MDLKNNAELVAFRSRCLKASQKGYTVAKAELYAKALAAEVGNIEPPLGTKSASAAHLHVLAGAVLEARTNGGKKKASKAPQAAAPSPPPEVLTEPAPASEVVSPADEGPPAPSEAVSPTDDGPAPASDEVDAGATKKKKKR